MIAALVLALLAGTYEAELARAVDLAREGRTAEARALLDELVASAPARREALAERGGLAFKEGRYADAIADLERALQRGDDPHTREVLAGALALDHRPEEALVHWNVLGRPLVRRITIEGLQHTRDAVARREVSVGEGEMLESSHLAETREQLEQVGVFRSVLVQPVMVAGGQVDVRVQMEERRGLGAPVEIAANGAANAVRKRARLHYRNLDGRGVNLGVDLHWDQRHETGMDLEWPRPLGLPAYLTLDGVHGRQPYALATPTTLRRDALGAAFRAVLAPGSLAKWGLRYEDRTFTVSRPDARSGRLLLASAGLTRRLARRPTLRIDAGAAFTHAFALDDSGAFDRHLGGVTAAWNRRGFESDDGSLALLEVALQLQAGTGHGAVPLDAMFTPGAAGETEFPLRAHKIRKDGVIGATAFGRTIYALNQELRVRILRRARYDVGLVPFLDLVHLPDSAQGGSRTLVDLGLGVRVGIHGSLLVRVDYGHSPTDGKDAFSGGIGQSF